MKAFLQTLGGQTAALLTVALVLGGGVNRLSPRGIPWQGQWDPSVGVIRAAVSPPEEAGFEIPTPSEARRLHQTGAALFVDARSPEAFQAGHIPGALSLPAGEAEGRLGELLDRYPPEQAFVTYCSGRQCEDSHRLAELLRAAGYRSVRVFIDGFPGWAAEGYPVE